MDIELKQLTKQYDKKTILQDLSVTFLESRINCLMGASGIGKTTLINCILGLVKPDSGEINGIKGKRITAVFQEDRLIEHWDAVKNIRLVCDKALKDGQIEVELSKVGLADYKDKPVKDFSGGMRRRVALIRAMLASYDILILDEPFKGLDDELKQQVIGYIKQNTSSKTVIIITHDKEDVELLEANLILLQ